MEYAIIVGIIIGGITGFLIAFLIGRTNQTRIEERNKGLELQLRETETRTREQLADAESRLETARERSGVAERQLAEMQAGLQTENRHLREKLTEQKQELEKLQETFTKEFENLANRILDEKSKKFTEQNREKLDELLKPLGVKLEEFKQKVEDTYDKETRDRTSLKEQIIQMAEMNKRMSDEANNLTRALKGDSKQQGNWGEVILQRILEKSGLTKGREYEIQESHTTEDGRRLQPDVIINLPDGKQLVIDSKVSLTAYERFTSAGDDAEQAHALRQHIASLRAHVKGLSGKNYQQLDGLTSPDFVLLFIPIEPAFGLAMQNAPEIYNEAFDKNIIIVSPTTLLATLATIQNVWKQEYQNQNALEIAKRGGALYDKFVLFVDSLTKIGERIRQTQESYDDAMGRLSSGSGNLVRQVEMLRKLGARTSKQLPEKYAEIAGTEESDEPEEADKPEESDVPG
ncbi:MAG: DNA recombination protein RmuC [Balneolaceae bacterium]|nr:MAG: DNA recombination protein RmuC [Balneolaceae bacterium]